MSEQYKSITQPFYSNCLFQAIKAKIMNPSKVHLTLISPKYNEVFCIHILWSDGEHDYDFGTPNWLNWYQVFWFKGTIRQYKLGFNKRYLAYRKHLYIKEKQKAKEAIKFFEQEKVRQQLHKRAEEAQKLHTNESRFGETEVRWEVL